MGPGDELSGNLADKKAFTVRETPGLDWTVEPFQLNKRFGPVVRTWRVPTLPASFVANARAGCFSASFNSEHKCHAVWTNSTVSE